jgi:hypothetical protein
MSWRIAFLPASNCSSLPHLTAWQHVMAADVERRMLLDEQSALGGSEGMAEQERLAAVEARLEAIGANQAERRVVRERAGKPSLGQGTTGRMRKDSLAC